VRWTKSCDGITPAATRATMVFGGDAIIVNDPNGAERALLAGLPSMR
jgi:hypothetical protein